LAFVNDQKFTVDKILFDTGALDQNYISSKLAKLLESAGATIEKIDSFVRLGDSKTTIAIKNKVTVKVGFTSKKGLVTAVTDFHILDNGYDMIVGLPTITSHFIAVLVEALLSDCSDSHFQALIHRFFLVDNSDLLEPFSLSKEEAPEENDDEVPLACCFSDALFFLGKSHEVQVQEYIDQLPSQISDGMLENCPKIMDLMMSKGMKVYIPQNWEGISGMEPIELDWDESLVPNELIPPRRHINPKLFATAKEEYFRLLGPFFRPSTSNICSPLVVAGKATYPFIRLCGDYSTGVNNWLKRHYSYIPNVQHILATIAGYKLFADLDLIAAFHQIKIAALSSRRLSVQTPWGQAEPMFMPEGVSSAPAFLQDVVRKIFHDFPDWLIYIFDNILILANTYEELYERIEMVFDRCIERNVYLKISKSFIGFTEVKFFGYKCTGSNWSLDEDRKQGIVNIPFPTTQKEARSFLGCGVFFQPFTENYAVKAEKLYDMTKDDFNWDKSTWIIDYEGHFNTLKNSMVNCIELFFPDYSLEWILRTDASDYAWGAALYQIFIGADVRRFYSL